MSIKRLQSTRRATLTGVLLVFIALASFPAAAHEPEFTDTFAIGDCEFTSAGRHPYFVLEPGHTLTFAGEEDGEEIGLVLTVLDETERVDGIETRVVEERETADDELTEISRNFFAICRQTNSVFYFGEDVDIFEDGEVVSNDGAWRAGVDGAQPGVIMPGIPMVGARYLQEQAPLAALDFGEIVSVDDAAFVPAGLFENVLRVAEGSLLDPEDESLKLYAPGVGMIVDDELELVQVTAAPCNAAPNRLCLNNGRFGVRAAWTDFEGNSGDATAVPFNNDSGALWFFNSDNIELMVKVLDACGDPDFNSFWVFAAGLTNVGVTLTVTDTATGAIREYRNGAGADFQPVLDTQAFQTCP